MFEELLPFIGQYGFPIFVAIYFMLRMERILENNTEALREMQRAFVDVVAQLEQLCSEVEKT